MPGLNDDLTRQVAENAVGGAVRLQDIEGVGDKTLRSLRSKGFRNVSDVKQADPERLQEVPGVGKSTAKRMIRSAGGNPNKRRRKKTRSVSAAGIKSPVGDFRVSLGDRDKAAATFDTSLGMGKISDRHRTQEAAASDKGHRAPITTDLDEWRANRDTLDFPGVDTPTDNPEFMQKDKRFISPDDVIGDVEDEIF